MRAFDLLARFFAVAARQVRTLKAILNKAVEWGDFRRNPIVHAEPVQRLWPRPVRVRVSSRLKNIYAPRQHADCGKSDAAKGKIL